ncbi:unnamed protein product [Adineta ricciae]|uniref:Uncharacterized protein n=1 Tax=Adineta ricciae TaxID=249248 RepID=A0A815W023_ADIRI|nr:unnamed protein product [Adineta ricciae]CAF1596964.1 unnamed protein product [Adineta ricciae]
MISSGSYNVISYGQSSVDSIMVTSVHCPFTIACHYVFHFPSFSGISISFLDYPLRFFEANFLRSCFSKISSLNYNRHIGSSRAKRTRTTFAGNEEENIAHADDSYAISNPSTVMGIKPKLINEVPLNDKGRRSRQCIDLHFIDKKFVSRHLQHVRSPLLEPKLENIV